MADTQEMVAAAAAVEVTVTETATVETVETATVETVEAATVETAAEGKTEEKKKEKKPKKDKKEKAEGGELRERRPAHFEDAEGLFKTVCRAFMAKKCKSKPCKHVHDSKLCRYYWRSGECRFGDECRNNHFVTAQPAEQAETEAAETAEEDKPKKDKKEKKPKEKKLKKDKKQDKKQDKPASDAEADEYGDSKAAKGKKKDQKKKKNTEVFEPMTKPVDLRITYDLGSKDDSFSTPLSSRDVVLVPNLFSDYKKGELYAKLVKELEDCGIPRDRLLKMWHGNDKIDGTHLIVDDRSSWKSKCPTFDLVTDRLQKFFNLSIKATRFNWYVDTSQWKPFHFDAAAVKPEIAAKQNFTVGISFGATRDAAFEHAGTKTTVSLPQPDGCVYAFARDTNVIWRHGILQDVPVRQEGRISVIAWGWVDGMTEPEAVVPTAPVLDQKVIGKK